MTHSSTSNTDPDSGSEPTLNSTRGVLDDVLRERQRQHQLWGEQNHQDGTGLTGDARRADEAKELNGVLESVGLLTFRDILYEEVLEVFAETDPERLREELVQVAAVAAAWVEALDRRAL